MIDNTSFLTIILYVMLAVMAALAMTFMVIYLNMKIKEKQSQKEDDALAQQKPVKKTSSKTFSIGSVFDFMEFDKIEDNMIIQKKGARYVMVVECQGINYDLMSQAEKVGVEEGFIQFLNTLSHPIQIYTQTRKVNLESSIQTYKSEVDKIEQEYNRQKIRYQNIVSSPNATAAQKQQALYEFTKERNLYEYGKDIIFNTEKMSLNRNILNKKYYIVIPYYSEDFGQGSWSKEEIQERAFSELYTKAQAIIATLSATGVVGRVLSSVELADLLYFAYNRDEAEIYGIDKAIRAGSGEMYSTAPDYMDKKMELLDKQIEDAAYDLAGTKVVEVQNEKQKEYQRKVETEDDIIKNLAQLIIQENEAMLGKDVAEKAKEKIRKEKKANVQ
mgnify:CR=1 FL=1